MAQFYGKTGIVQSRTFPENNEGTGDERVRNQ